MQKQSCTSFLHSLAPDTAFAKAHGSRIANPNCPACATSVAGHGGDAFGRSSARAGKGHRLSERERLPRFELGQVVKNQTMRLEVFEVLIQRAQPQLAANGKGRQVSVHPHLGRSQLGRCQAVPQRHRALWLVAFADLRQGRKCVDRRQRIAIGKRVRAVVFQHY
jgi:hypothetical protein